MPEPLDEFDRSLRDRIGAAEARVRLSSAPPDGRTAAPAPARWLRPALVLATAAVAVVLALLVIDRLPDRSVGGATPLPSAAPPSSAPGPVSASARDGDFVLTVSSPRSVWTTGDAIEITAILSYEGDETEVAIGGACGPIAFDLVQLSGGSAAMGYAQCEPYISYPLGPDTPLVQAFEKSGELRDEPPFDRAFFEDPELHLPPGRWRTLAILDFDHPQGSGFRTLEVSIEFDVVEADGLPDPSPIGTPRVCPAALGHGVLGADDQGRAVLITPDLESPVPIVWLFPDVVRIDPGPPLRILDPNGGVLATEGDDVTLGGGWGANDTEFYACGLIDSGPTQEPSPPHDDRPSVTGLLQGDPQLEGGCAWLRDQAGTRWEIIWPKPYEATFRNGSAVLVAEGEVVATVGDRITVYGSRPSGAGSHCMVGIVYEAESVLIR